MRRAPHDDVELETAEWSLSDITLIPMALPEDTTSAEARGFLVAALTVSWVAFDLAFDVAVWGDLFFRSYLTLWAFGFTLLLASAFLPEARRPVGCGGMAVLALPALYFPGAFITTWVLSNTASDVVIYVLGVFIVWLVSALLALTTLIALPFLMLTLARVLDPTIIAVPTVRMRLGLAGIAVVMAMAGFGLGFSHPYWLTCEDFAIAGGPPPSCTPVGPGWR